MKKFLAIFCILNLIFCFCVGCKSDKTQTKDSKELFHEFMRGELTAIDESGEEKYLDGGYTKTLSNKYNYCFIDMNGDEKDELCILNPNEKHYFFTEKNGKLYFWHMEDAMKTVLLNNGAFLYERHGAASEHINYKYHEVDKNGNVNFSIEFTWYDSVYLSLENKYRPESFEINGTKVTKAEYVEKTSKYLKIGSDKIVWYDKDGNVVSENKTEKVDVLSDGLSESLIREIEDAYKAELLTGDNSTIGMVERTAKYTNMWQQVSNEYYDKLINYESIEKYGEIGHTADEFHSYIKNMKTSWEKYYADQCENYREVLFTIYGAGTITKPIFADYQYEMQKDWALRLVEIYEQLG